MGEKFDPYYKWLGIPPKDQPPHHYRLLGIELFEQDREVIDAAANRLMGYLKDLAVGDEGAYSQDLLNEIARARICLLNEQKKAAYDAELRGQLATDEQRINAAQTPPPQVQPPVLPPDVGPPTTGGGSPTPPPPAVPGTESNPAPAKEGPITITPRDDRRLPASPSPTGIVIVPDKPAKKAAPGGAKNRPSVPTRRHSRRVYAAAAAIIVVGLIGLVLIVVMSILLLTTPGGPPGSAGPEPDEPPPAMRVDESVQAAATRLFSQC
jgi:hypothetical protein